MAMYFISLILVGLHLCFGQNIEITNSNVYMNSDVKENTVAFSDKGFSEQIHDSVLQVVKSFLKNKVTQVNDTGRTNQQNKGLTSLSDNLDDNLSNLVLRELRKIEETFEKKFASIVDRKLRHYSDFNLKRLSTLQSQLHRLLNDSASLGEHDAVRNGSVVDGNVIDLYHSNMKMLLESVKTTIKRYSKQISDFEDRIHTLESEALVSKASKIEWQSKTRNIKSELTKLQQMFGSLNDTIDELDDKIKTLDEEYRHELDVLAFNITEEVEKEEEEKPPLGKDCLDIYSKGFRADGVYLIQPLGTTNLPFEVYCDMADGGWTVLQKRINGSLGFERNWEEYVHGFGDLNHEFWIGLEHIHRLTKTPRKVKFDFQLLSGEKMTLSYRQFQVKGAETSYQLDVSGHISGFHSRSFIYNSGKKFSTFDRDNPQNCAASRKGGWWYENCTYLSINTLYNVTNSESGLTEHYQSYHNFKKTTMKII